MILQKIAQAIRQQDWFQVTIEIIIVVIGIFLGLQVTEWSDRRSQEENTKVLAQSIIDDLEADVVALETSINYSRNKIDTIDRFSVLLRTPRAGWDSIEFYDGANTVASLIPYSYTDGTYQQLRASGTLQYFDQLLLNKMNAYDNQIKKTIVRKNITDERVVQFANLMTTIINFDAILAIRGNQSTSAEYYIKLHDPGLIENYLNQVLFIRVVTGLSLEQYESQMDIAQSLMEEIKQKYDLTL